VAAFATLGLQVQIAVNVQQITMELGRVAFTAWQMKPVQITATVPQVATVYAILAGMV